MEKLTYIIDIDGTICTNTDGDYKNCIPFNERIKVINELYDEGNTVIYHTARGMGSTNGNQLLATKKYYDYTLKQLKEWGCRFHHLYLGKPKGDIYIDDKSISDNQFFDIK